ncbi:MAG: SsrA-binding protein [Candidatus Portnoybacteria bacterium CG_4_8_14_3_um_filter_44_10]|uniref:SsrA-binding protein n=4 Tax=Candidatus Portnoyibacteriota TaxID=1817913 RepID=A0A2H0WX12_9BACT|nr:MAG: SsrA-binding protein [Parcubacteria group bacterium CG2_30_44_18]PIS16459.1 MAG: SsrA-binding protein [Candidatus Portnoybacteria bacterium CG09_land_8_20_14_0_10_44_13]PIW75509.1 MAG: SsrA-binding protein [Candidatus Portnoybacteria bacterium CG_4_8_14_3_um_filter_44_10]PJA63575.1 MAG: SsrA-binding protein [Candidatus Portnoybacteria bacterium CG_4_9_14_3_um_filter_44_9]
MATLTYNRRATFDYSILETYEAGILLAGHEVKSIRSGHLSLAGSYVTLKDNEVYLINAYIPPYQPKNISIDYDAARTRKLLLRKAEINSLVGKIKQKGLTLIPLRVYTKGSKLKLEFGLARGKKEFDKRAAIIEREDKRKIDRALHEKY